MARPIRFQYPGGCYHIMARGDGGKIIFEDDDDWKVLLAALLRRRTTVGLEWISGKLVMGHPGSVSRLIGGISKNRELAKRLEELDGVLKCEDWPL